jgi:hypothetical protein
MTRLSLITELPVDADPLHAARSAMALADLTGMNVEIRINANPFRRVCVGHDARDAAQLAAEIEGLLRPYRKVAS